MFITKRSRWLGCSLARGFDGVLLGILIIEKALHLITWCFSLHSLLEDWIWGCIDPLVEHPSILEPSGHYISLIIWLASLGFTYTHLLTHGLLLGWMNMAWLGLFFSNALALMDGNHMGGLLVVWTMVLTSNKNVPLLELILEDILHILMRSSPFLMSCLITLMTWHMVDEHIWPVLSPSSTDLAHCALFHDWYLAHSWKLVTSQTLNLSGLLHASDALLLSTPPCNITIHTFSCINVHCANSGRIACTHVEV